MREKVVAMRLKSNDRDSDDEWETTKGKEGEGPSIVENLIKGDLGKYGCFFNDREIAP